MQLRNSFNRYNQLDWIRCFHCKPFRFDNLSFERRSSKDRIRLFSFTGNTSLVCLSGASSIRNKINFQIYDFIFLSKRENSIECFHFIISCPLFCGEVNYGVTKTIKMGITKGYISPHCSAIHLKSTTEKTKFLVLNSFYFGNKNIDNKLIWKRSKQ